MQAAVDVNPTDLSGANASLRDLLDVGSAEDVLSSFYALFQIPIRVLEPDGRALAKNRKQPALNEYLAELPGVAERLREVYATLRQREPGEDGQFSLTCFTGATYHVACIAHDGRRIGRIVFGPYQTSAAGELPNELLECAPELDVARARELLAALPRVREETIRSIARHLAVLLDALIFAGYRAWLTESMHLSAVRESFRELADKADLLEQAERRISDLDRSRASFLADVASELSANLEELDAGQLRELARQLSDLAGLERRALALHKTCVDPGKLLSEVRAELETRPRTPSVELALLAPGSLPPIWADAARLRQALTLLAGAAVGRAAVPLRLEAVRREVVGDSAQSGAWVLFGAPLPAVLEFRVIHGRQPLTEPEQKLPGSAQLARALAARLAEAHGGALSVEEHPPAGPAFVLTLPFEEPPRPPA
jgi:two-component system, NarL family, sensor histidine kinase BarA